MTVKLVTRHAESPFPVPHTFAYLCPLHKQGAPLIADLLAVELANCTLSVLGAGHVDEAEAAHTHGGCKACCRNETSLDTCPTALVLNRTRAYMLPLP
jgi:hypothetical protein